ncbi:hypothetical protein [Streptomyces otsuchiensis]|uniref:hypothetical protein n=1 Tax=Streptomyces otsuchiensis TaxID=2681388 RepID=UPI001D1314AE|nr:hypothetical protein [Streptomyces otsuchiensis]
MLSEGTVKTRVKRVMSELFLAGRAQAVVVAYETGLVRPGAASAPEYGGLPPGP